MAILISALLTFGLYRITVSWLRDGLQHRITDAVSVAAHRLDGKAFNQLTDPAQEGQPAYLDLQNQLRNIRDAGSDYRFVYTLRKTQDGKIRFIVDAEEDPELISHLGDFYDDAGPTLVENIDSLSSPMVEESFYTDKWGTWLTGYAPIPMPEGEPPVILCIDIPATTELQRERDFLWAALLVFGISLPFSLLAGTILGRKLTAPVKDLTYGAERITHGDLDHEVKPHGNDEIGDLARAFNTMTRRLSWSLKALKQSKEEVTRHRDNLELLVSERTAKLEEANKRMNKDLQQASQVQKAFLPQHPPQLPGVHFAWSFIPCDELAGDMLDICKIDSHRVGIWIADVCGHGVASALVSVTLSHMLSTINESEIIHTSDNTSTGAKSVPIPEIASFLNGHFSWDPDAMRYFTLLYGILDTNTKEFRYVSAGHPSPILVNKEGKAKTLPMSPPGIGILPDAKFVEHSITLDPGDQLFLYTDGVIEASNATEEEFGEQRLSQTLEKYHQLPLQQTVDSLLDDLTSWLKKEQPTDDLSIVAFKID